eukprot:m.34658 g.34658  ORF g.34658 m.34658 type:complete len:66 (-) comp12330_c0_seq2:444-641(-)
MSDEIRAWFMECRETTGKFPDFPSSADGGSKAIFNPPPAAEEIDGGKKKKASAKGAHGWNRLPLR